jgi:hypothetical protein
MIQIFVTNSYHRCLSPRYLSYIITEQLSITVLLTFSVVDKAEMMIG